MKIRTFLFAGLLALLTLFCNTGQAQTLSSWQNICWNNVSSYDIVRVHFQNQGSSDYDSNMTVNGVTVGSTGKTSGYAGYRDVPGSGISLGWVRVGGSSWFSYSPRIDYGPCNPTFEDTGQSPLEGYFWFEGANYLPTLSLTKFATPSTLVAGATGQRYTLSISVVNGPTTGVISVSDALPAGITTSGAITATGGSLYGCPAAGASSLAGCTVAAGTNGPITITIPVTVSTAAAASVTNRASISGGGDSTCNGAGACTSTTTNPVVKVVAVDDAAVKVPGVATSTSVSGNDTFPVNSTFTVTGGTCQAMSPTSPATNTTGVLSYTPVTGGGNLAGSFGVLNGTTLQMPASTVMAGADLQCTFYNTFVGQGISGKVILDTGVGSGSAHDAIQNGTEVGHAGVTVSLTNCSGTTYSTTTTGGDGSFLLGLTGVPANQAVCVVQSLPSGYGPVSVNAGTATGATASTTANSTTLKFTPAANTAYSGIVLGNAPVSTLSSDGAQQTLAGQTVTYAHIYTAGSAGSVAFSTASTSTPANAPWSATLFVDANCNSKLDSGEVAPSAAMAVTAGQQVCLINRIFAPAGLSAGAQDSTLLRATQSWSTPTLSAATQSKVLQNTDITTISSVGLNLIKEVRKLSSCPATAAASQALSASYSATGTARPGDALEYRIRYSNNAASPIKSVKLYDAVPAYTQFKVAYCLSTPMQGVTGCSVTQQPGLNATSGSVAWELADVAGQYGGLQPSDSGAVGFCITVQQ